MTLRNCTPAADVCSHVSRFLFVPLRCAPCCARPVRRIANDSIPYQVTSVLIRALSARSDASRIVALLRHLFSLLVCAVSSQFDSAQHKSLRSLAQPLHVQEISAVKRPFPELRHWPRPRKAPYSNHSRTAGSYSADNSVTSNSMVAPSAISSDMASATRSPCAV